MSAGTVVCSDCSREVHQDGPRNHNAMNCRCPHDTGWCPATWRHCEDGTPRCYGAASVYPKPGGDIPGGYCGKDDLA
jgi:hypothetical protein